MNSKFTIDIPFQKKPPSLRELVNHHVMGDVWVRDTPFGPVTDSLKIAEKFEMEHKNVLRAIKKCRDELSIELKFELNENLIDNEYLAGRLGGKRNLISFLNSENLFIGIE